MLILENNIKGFSNIGNTCYLNAGLQMIIHNKDLCNLIILNKKNNKILETLSNFIIEYYNTTSDSIVPNKIKDYIEKTNKMFKGSKQHDSSEFIFYLLDLINDELNNQQCNLLNTLYEVTSNIKIKCKLRSCLNISEHTEKSNYLLFDIKDSFTNLDDCYNEYKSRIKFEGDELYFCENCNDKRVASKRLQIINWPKHLIIILKRFNQNNEKVSKNNTNIHIPEIWKYDYKLKGIIYHSGSLNGGHYIYIGKHNNIWYSFNDNFVSTVNINDFNKFKNNGYIYYFEK